MAKNTGENVVTSSINFFRESIAMGIEGILKSVLSVIEQETLALFRKLLKTFALFFFSVLAVVFLLVGIARVLDTVYQVPGVGEIAVGALILSGVLLVFLVEQSNQSK